MDKLGLTLAHKHGMWFGVLVDAQNRLVASAFLRDRQGLKNYLDRYGRKVVGFQPVEMKHEFAEDMTMLFEGLRAKSTLSFSSEPVSSFQKQVYAVLTKVPRGKVTEYGLIAKTIRSHPRAVGTAVASNPWPLFVPCHRVVPRNLAIGNYSMNGHPSLEGSRVKRELLEREGVPFKSGRVAPSAVWVPPGAR